MSTKKLLTLTAIFLALLAFVVFFERNQPTSEEAAKARKKLIDFKADSLVGMTIERPGLPKVELAKEAGGRWLVGGEPADSGTVSGIISDLGRLDLVGETRTGFDPTELGLDAPRAKVFLAFSGQGKEEILFGKEIPGTDATAAASGGRFGAVRFAPVASLVKPYDDFRSKSLFDVPSSDVTRLTVTRGSSRVVVARVAGPEKDGRPPEWRIEEPVKDLASRSFVDQLLADLSGARISEFPTVSASDLSRIGLQPPTASVELRKGTEVVANLAFGAARADAAGKMYARRGKTVVVIDDRLQDDLSKEFTAFREKKICPVDAWAAVRVSFDAPDLRVGAERVDAEWRSSGRPIASSAPEDLIDRIGRTESTAFLPRKSFPAHGLPGPGKKMPAPTISIDVTARGEPPVTLRFYLGGSAIPPEYVVEVSGRADAMVVSQAAVDEIRGLASKLQTGKAGTKAPASAQPKTR